ncbi:MAG: FKBP-type peptidyl-prolyl cis-trans isomerase [Chlamydiota bacterium]
MAQVEAGSKVKVNIKGKTPEGHEFTTGEQHQGGLEIVLGQGQMLPAIESAIIGMSAGENKDFVVSVEEGIPHRADLLFDIEREALPDDRDYEVGDNLVLSMPGGDEMEVTIEAINDTHFKLDANPPIAGKELHVNVVVLEIL